MVANAPGFGKIAHKLREFIGTAIIVGHNIPFDIRFLDYEFQRLRLPPLLNETVDTITLALRLHPGMKRPNLDRLATLVGLPVANRHRAYGDASITAEAFLILLSQAAQKGFSTLADLRSGKPFSPATLSLRAQAGRGLPENGHQSLSLELELSASQPTPGTKTTLFEMEFPEKVLGVAENSLDDPWNHPTPEGSPENSGTEIENELPKRPVKFPQAARYRPEVASLTNRATARARHVLSRDLIKDLPAKPGVYLMKDETGKVIYVGKAKSLRDRVSSYYSTPMGYTRKMDGLIESIKQIDHIVVGSELEALLLESKKLLKGQT